ncbi:MAG: hypothetical protein IKC32_00975 [Clostridia bacterium]|nr:hypothetical protein [Clostridia bacterium]
MKSKIICLLICIASVISLLASCGTPACEAHADEDKNRACDNCGIPVYTVVERVPTDEAAVEMVVTPIPTDKKLGDLYKTDYEENPKVGDFTLIEDFTLGDVINRFDNDRYIFYGYTEQTAGTETTLENWTDTSYPTGYLDDDKYIDHWCIYDVLGGETCFSLAGREYTIQELWDGHVDDVSCTESMGEFLNMREYRWTKDENGYWSQKEIDTYRFFNGDLIISSEETGVDSDLSFSWYGDRNGIEYYEISGNMYAISFDEDKIIHKEDMDSFVFRPDFDYVTDTHGYLYSGGKLLVYDLSKWIECVYSYELPDGASYFYLADGNILIQRVVILPDSAKNYDYTDGTKYDLVYTLIDPIAKTETEIEFGYYVNYSDVYVDDYGFVDSVKNILNVSIIENKNLGKKVDLACDSSLGIIAEIDAVLPELVESVILVADGVFMGDIVYGDGSLVTALFDAEGNRLATLPEKAILSNGVIVVEDKYYDMKLDKLFDLNADPEHPYSYAGMLDGALLVADDEGQYYCKPGNELVPVMDYTNVPSSDGIDTPELPDPILVQRPIMHSGVLFVVETSSTTLVEGTPVTTYTYTVYNQEIEKVLEIDYFVDDMNLIYSNVNDDRSVILTDDEGNLYISKTAA